MDQNLYIVAIVEKQCLIQPCIMNVVGGASQVNLSLWLTHLTYYNASVITGGLDFTSSNRVYLFSKGYVDIKTGAYHFDTHEISRSELPPEIYTR